MKSEHGYRWLLGELPHLLSEHIMDSTQAEALSRYCHKQLEDKVDKTQKIALSIFAIFGVLLLCSGTILFFNYNWDRMVLPVRLTISFLPFAIGIILGIFTLWKRDRFAWREISAVVTACGIAVSWALVSQIYQLDGSLPDFLFGVLLLSFGLIIVFDSCLLEILYIIGMYLFMDSVKTNEYQIPLLSILILCRVMHRMWNRNTSNIILGQYFLLLLLPVCLFVTSFRETWLISSFATFLPLAFALAWIRYDNTGNQGYLNPLFLVCWGGMNLFWVVANLLFDDLGIDYSFLSLFSLPVSTWILWLLITLVLVGVPLLRLYRQRPFDWNLAVILAGIPIILCGITTPFVLNTYQILFGIMLSLCGIKRKDMTLFSMGILTFFCLALTKFFSTDMDVLLRAAGFGGCGLAMLIADFYFYRYCRRAKNARKEVA